MKEENTSSARLSPSKLTIFRLTSQGNDLFPKAYTDIALCALSFIETTRGVSWIAKMLRMRQKELFERYSKLIEAQPSLKVENSKGWHSARKSTSVYFQDPHGNIMELWAPQEAKQEKKVHSRRRSDRYRGAQSA